MRIATRSVSIVVLLAGLSAAAAAPLSPPEEANAESTEVTCRIDAQEHGLSGRALDQSMQACVAQESPTLGYWEHCRQSARHAHLKGLALRDDVTACMEREP